jgi:hypothetical protein
MHTNLTGYQLAQVADTLIDAIDHSALKRYCTDIYGPEAHLAQVLIHTDEGILLEMHVFAWNEDGFLLAPNLCLPYWKRIERETDTFELCHTRIERAMAAHTYIQKRQLPQEYGIKPMQTEQIVLHEIKSLDEIELYVQDGLPLATLHLTHVEEKKIALS